jgi:hypothetical protein
MRGRVAGYPEPINTGTGPSNLELATDDRDHPAESSCVYDQW